MRGLRVSNDGGPLEHHDAATAHQRFDLRQDAVDVFLRVHRLDDDRQSLGSHLDGRGVHSPIVPEAGETQEDGGARQALFAQELEDPSVERCAVQRARLAQDRRVAESARRRCLASDASADPR